MGIIYVGAVVDQETLKALPDASVAGNKMQLGFVKGFHNLGIDITVISVESHGMWRLNGKPLVIKKKYLQDEKIRISTIGYINFPGLKQIMIQRSIEKQLDIILSSGKYKDSTLMVYNTMSFFAHPVLKMKKKYNVKAVAIIADLPIQEKKNILRVIEDKKEIEAIKKFDALIPLTRLIATDFAPGIPYCVVEAGCSVEYHVDTMVSFKAHTEKAVVFSGTLNQLSGIELVIEAIRKLSSQNITLHIYGDGPLRRDVEQVAHNVDNIIYHGRVPNDKMLQIQRKADLLVCPRKSDDFTTKYTFPSKILEYICSGVPVLANRLPGIPQEYERYINYTENESEASWAAAITKILDSTTAVFYRQKAQTARKAVLAEKTWEKQAKKCIEVLDKQDFHIC